VGALPEDIEAWELGQVHGDVRQQHHSKHNLESEELRETPELRHEPEALTDKADKAIIHDNILDGRTGLPYNQ